MFPIKTREYKLIESEVMIKVEDFSNYSNDYRLYHWLSTLLCDHHSKQSCDEF